MEYESGQNIPYPTGIFPTLFRLPIFLHRLGLGHLVGLARVLILTTRGRKSALARHSALEFRQHGSKIYLVSAWGDRPDWYRNLQADPYATVQIGREVLNVRAHLVDSPAEAVNVLYMFRRRAPFIYDRLLTRMSTAESIDLNTLVEIAREFRIMRLEIVPDAPRLPAVRSDLSWVWTVGVSVMVFTMLIRLTRSRRS